METHVKLMEGMMNETLGFCLHVPPTTELETEYRLDPMGSHVSLEDD